MMTTELVIFNAKVYDATEVFQLKKVYDKVRKRVSPTKNYKWQYKDEVEVQKAQRSVGAAIADLRVTNK